jgi:hypothetical protein
MKTNNNVIKGFKSVDFMRQVRDQISKDVQNMNFSEIQNYFQERRLHRTTISGKKSILL